MKKIVILLLIHSILGFIANAGVFNAVAITGSTDVLTDGTFVEAKNYTDGTPVTSVTVNGIAFEQADTTGWSYDISNAPGFSAPVMKVGSWDANVFYTRGTQLGNMLNSSLWLGGGGNPTGATMSYTLTGLTQNTDYRMQLFMADMRDYNHPFSISVDGGAASSIFTVGALAPAPGIAVRIDVYFSTGALDEDVVITLICEQDNITGGFGGPQLSGYALHAFSCVGDLDGNGFVNLQDFAVFSRCWLDSYMTPSQTPLSPGTAGKIPAASRQSVVGAGRDYLPRPHIFADPDWYHWGGSCVRGDDGQYHLFYCRWPDPMNNWLYVGQICHATASVPQGPYTFESIVLEGPGDNPQGRWDAYNAVNPYIARLVDPADQQLKYYLYFVANRDDNDSGISDWYDRASKQRIGVAVADSPYGPWTRHANNPVCVPDNQTVHWYTVNPAVCQLPDGRFLMLMKGRTGQSTSAGYITGWALADSPTGPFVIQNTLAIPANLRAEDPCVWIQDGVIYSAVRDWYGDITGAGGIAWMKGEIGNGTITWDNITGVSARISSRQIKWDDDQTTTLNRLERPFVLLDETGKPEYMFCAASVDAPSASSVPFNVCIPLEPVISKTKRINIALAKPTVSSSAWSSSYTADKAVDGSTGTLTHSGLGDTAPYWEVDLGKQEPLDEVVIVNRPGFAGRLRDIRIEVLDSQRQSVYTSDLLNPGNELGGGIDDYNGNEPAELVLTLTDETQGNYIRITRVAEGSSNEDLYILSMSEVELYKPDFLADFNNDGIVNVFDLTMLADNWCSCQAVAGP